jgi:hypothetical protein
VRKGGANLSSAKIPHKEFSQLLEFDGYLQAKGYIESFNNTLEKSLDNENYRH